MSQNIGNREPISIPGRGVQVFIAKFWLEFSCGRNFRCKVAIICHNIQKFPQIFFFLWVRYCAIVPDDAKKHDITLG